MKTLVVPAIILMTMMAATPAAGGSVSIGNSVARDCYEAAIARNSDPANPYRAMFGATYTSSKTALNAITRVLLSSGMP